MNRRTTHIFVLKKGFAETNMTLKHLYILPTLSISFKRLITLLVFYIAAISLNAQEIENVNLIPVDSGWANNSVNATVFRKNSLVTWKDTQYISYYNKTSHVVIGKRNLGSKEWLLYKTPFIGNTRDAHNTISIMTDGEGYLHIAWDHHNTPLKYCRSIEPGSFDFAVMNMTGTDESKVSYPEFFKLNNGNLLFLYRSGQSGKGKLVVNEYNVKEQTWLQLQNNLIDGEGQRNAYWQSYVDVKGTIHISWVWRESADVASNHDMCYAQSKDNGRTWLKSTGEKYQLPITAATAEYIWRIPENSELINQTSMSADEEGNAYVASYWREQQSKIPQYHILYRDNDSWKHLPLNFRKSPFTLSGQGTKRIPISRPQLLVSGHGQNANAFLLFRDEERGNKVSVVTIDDIQSKNFTVSDLTSFETGAWEPSFDSELWKEKNILNLFVQNVEQADAEGFVETPAQLVYVLEWNSDQKE